MTSTAVPGRPLAADDGWAILAQPPGERDLALEDYWQHSLERSRRRREAPRRPRVVRRGASGASLALTAAVLGAPLVGGAASAAGAGAATRTLDLRRGATGGGVQALQRALGVSADGIFGPQTLRAVKRFQRAHGIPATGYVGTLTTAALRGRVAVGGSVTGARTAPAGGAATPAAAPAPPARAGVQDAVGAALSKVGAPYRSGGTGPSSFDCSGLVQWAMREVGLAVPRTSFAQFGVGTRVGAGAIQAGDLVFFDTAGPGASDVGIAVSPTSAVSATTHGVMTHAISSGYWGEHFVGARRLT